MRLLRKPIQNMGAIVLILTVGLSLPSVAMAASNLFTQQELAMIRGFYNWADGESGGGDRQYRYDGDVRGEYDGKGGKGKPPGLAKKPGGLAPGHKKQLARGKGLPPGIAKKQLPSDLRNRLPARNGSYIRIVDNDIVLIEAGTEIVLDILTDIVR